MSGVVLYATRLISSACYHWVILFHTDISYSPYPLKYWWHLYHFWLRDTVNITGTFKYPTLYGHLFFFFPLLGKHTRLDHIVGTHLTCKGIVKHTFPPVENDRSIKRPLVSLNFSHFKWSLKKKKSCFALHCLGSRACLPAESYNSTLVQDHESLVWPYMSVHLKSLLIQSKLEEMTVCGNGPQESSSVSLSWRDAFNNYKFPLSKLQHPSDC